MAIGRDARRSERRSLVAASMPPADIEAALELLDLVDVAWHDCYGDTPPTEVIEQVLVVGRGNLRDLVSAGLLAVIDRRDLHLAAEAITDGRHDPAGER